MSPGETFDERVYWAVLFDCMPYASNFLDSEKMTTEDFRDFLVDKLRP